MVLPTDVVRGLSSAGRAVALQASGHRFDPDRLHQFRAQPARGVGEHETPEGAQPHRAGNIPGMKKAVSCFGRIMRPGLSLTL